MFRLIEVDRHFLKDPSGIDSICCSVNTGSGQIKNEGAGRKNEFPLSLARPASLRHISSYSLCKRHQGNESVVLLHTMPYTLDEAIQDCLDRSDSTSEVMQQTFPLVWDLFTKFLAKTLQAGKKVCS